MFIVLHVHPLTVNRTYFEQFVNYCVCILVNCCVLSIVYFGVLLLKLKLCPELGLSAIHCVPLSVGAQFRRRVKYLISI